MEGYIQLHRQLLDSYQFSNPNMLKMWIWMLLRANHKKSVISLKVGKKYTDVVVDRGQFIFGRTKASSELEMDESAIYRMVKKLEFQNAITVKSNNQYSIVTICKYDTYNKKEKSDEQPVNSERTATEQPLNTYNNVNNDNKVNKEVVEALNGFIEMRKKIKKPLTERALKMIKEKAWNLSGKNEKNVVLILNQSTLNAWQDVFPLREEKVNSRFVKHQQDDYAINQSSDN